MIEDESKKKIMKEKFSKNRKNRIQQLEKQREK